MFRLGGAKLIDNNNIGLLEHLSIKQLLQLFPKKILTIKNFMNAFCAS